MPDFDFSNILQFLGQQPVSDPMQAPQQAPAAPQVDPMQALMARQPVANPMQEIAAPAAAPAPPQNFMQAGVTPDVPQPVQPPQSPPAPDSAREPRPRRSLLDTIGRISDVLAKVGGAEALYQPSLDARQDREIAQGDHSRAVDLDALRKRQIEQQLGQGETESANALDDRQRGILGQAVKGLAAINARSGSAGLVAAWPQMAQMLGLDPAKTKQIGDALAADPEGTLEGLSGALDPTKASGSQAKELQVYNLLKKNSPELAEKYLSGIASGTGAKAITPYQQAQINLAMRRQGFNEYKFAHPQVKPDAKAAAAEHDQVAAAEAAVPIIEGMKDAITRLNAAGSMNSGGGQSAEGRIGAWAMQNVPGLERITNPAAFSAREDLDRLTTQGIGSLLPLLGGIKLGGKNIDAAKELDTWKKAIVSAKDYPSALRALKGFEDRIEQLTSGSQGGSPAPSSGAPRRIVPRAAPRRAAPAAGGWGKATVVGK